MLTLLDFQHHATEQAHVTTKLRSFLVFFSRRRRRVSCLCPSNYVWEWILIRANKWVAARHSDDDGWNARKYSRRTSMQLLKQEKKTMFKLKENRVEFNLVFRSACFSSVGALPTPCSPHSSGRLCGWAFLFWFSHALWDGDQDICSRGEPQRSNFLFPSKSGDLILKNCCHEHPYPDRIKAGLLKWWGNFRERTYHACCSGSCAS